LVDQQQAVTKTLEAQRIALEKSRKVEDDLRAQLVGVVSLLEHVDYPTDTHVIVVSGRTRKGDGTVEEQVPGRSETSTAHRD
jgi:hypothetical protein